MSSPPLTIAILGSTGSIGESTLKVVDRFPDRLRVGVLAASRNAERLAAQALRYCPDAIALTDETREGILRSALSGYRGKILIGKESLAEVACWPSVQTVVVAVVGFAGLSPTLAAINAGKNIALANKETLVAAGSVVMPQAERHGITIAPIDSEHSAIWQCLRAGERGEVRRIILTASGGPFRTRSIGSFGAITTQEALAHPTWRMGPRITIDSATMMNKAFEIIEASWLFDLKPGQIDVVIHPQSVIHSMVEFVDGSVIAQLGLPDMTLPIAYALFAPDRPAGIAGIPPLNLDQIGSLEFSKPDTDRYPALALTRRTLEMGPAAGAVLNAADEVAVSAFLGNRIPFPRIIGLVEEALDAHTVVFDAGIDDIETADRWAREFVGHRIGHPVTA